MQAIGAELPINQVAERIYTIVADRLFRGRQKQL